MFKFSLKYRLVRWATFAIVVCYPVVPIHAETLRIAVASNFLRTAQELAHQFEQQSGHLVLVSSGSSGKLFFQISNGAPFDLFMSADSVKPSKLVKNDLALANSQQTYAKGKLALWLKNCSASPSLSDITNRSVKKIALANPKLAPYGSASKQLLEKLLLWKGLSSKLVQPENISQVAQLAKMGVVDAAFIAQSSVVRLNIKEPACIVSLKTSGYSPIEQQLIIVSNSKNIPLAEKFTRFLNSRTAHNLIKKRGYLLPDSDKISLGDPS